jgi:predicted lipid-binding transport protein (Tim44 family)
MKLLLKTLIVAVAGVGLLIANPDDAFAKRLGGGKSFGGRPSYSQPYRPGPDVNSASRGAPSAMQAPAQRNQAMRDSFRTRGGFMGMLGGLALGGLIGAMLFGGAFEHINFLDIAILGLVAYLLFRLFAARRPSPGWQTGAGSVADDLVARRAPVPDLGSSRPGQRSAGFDTDVMFRRGSTAGGAHREPVGVPASFDQAAFLAGAQQAYRHLQKAWDEKDRSELRALTTDRVFEELAAEMSERVGSDRTDILGLEARLLSVETVGDTLTASVLFTARIREESDAFPADIDEVWHFVRKETSQQPTWYLDGIQQVAA